MSELARGTGLDDAGWGYKPSGALEATWGWVVSHDIDDSAVVSPGHSSSSEYATPEESVCKL